jgi:hypothetical protein
MTNTTPLKDMYQTKWLLKYMNEDFTLIWSPQLILADVIMQLIELLQETSKNGDE